jgi:tripartite-type tricarboxylate transporter receptor subunit TctC
LGIFAPAKTPPAIITRLNREIVRVLNQPEIKERFASAGVEAGGGSPEQFAAKINAEMIKWSKLFKQAGIRDE